MTHRAPCPSGCLAPAWLGSRGEYFHPLLGTLVTGAARLTLALAEYQVSEQKLDWGFCDTESIAIANASDLPLDEFKARALIVRDWFKDLNPYGEDNSILQLEKVNFPEAKEGDLGALDPPFCLAVSAKRYVLFNRTAAAEDEQGHGGKIPAKSRVPQACAGDLVKD